MTDFLEPFGLPFFESLVPGDWHAEGGNAAIIDTLVERADCGEDVESLMAALKNMRCVPLQVFHIICAFAIRQASMLC
jgi:hypothetical protein